MLNFFNILSEITIFSIFLKQLKGIQQEHNVFIWNTKFTYTNSKFSYVIYIFFKCFSYSIVKIFITVHKPHKSPSGLWKLFLQELSQSVAVCIVTDDALQVSPVCDFSAPSVCLVILTIRAGVQSACVLRGWRFLLFPPC